MLAVVSLAPANLLCLFTRKQTTSVLFNLCVVVRLSPLAGLCQCQFLHLTWTSSPVSSHPDLAPGTCPIRGLLLLLLCIAKWQPYNWRVKSCCFSKLTPHQKPTDNATWSPIQLYCTCWCILFLKHAFKIAMTYLQVCSVFESRQFEVLGNPFLRFVAES